MPGDTHTCFSCGDGDNDGDDLPDGSDCSGGSSSIGCHNPCGGPSNTAQCEQLPSQISNFTLQFFGSITKTDDGQGNVTWQLPCGLDVGLPSNPRAVGEGLACYFLRLFSGIIVANQGPQGIQGPPGHNGQDAFTITTQNVNQPTPAQPIVQAIISPNSLFVAGLNIFLQNSGYYLITDVLNNGTTLILQLVKPVVNPPPIIPAGSLIVPAGPPGQTVPGPQGIQGFTGPVGPVGQTGPVGPVGPSFPVSFSQYIPPNNIDYIVTNSYAVVQFGSSLVQVILGSAGTYLVTVNLTIASTFASQVTNFKLRNITTASDIAGSAFALTTPVYTNSVTPVSATILFATTAPNQQIQLWAQGPSASVIKAANTTIALIRIA